MYLAIVTCIVAAFLCGIIIGGRLENDRLTDRKHYGDDQPPTRGW